MKKLCCLVNPCTKCSKCGESVCINHFYMEACHSCSYEKREYYRSMLKCSCAACEELTEAFEKYCIERESLEGLRDK